MWICPDPLGHIGHRARRAPGGNNTATTPWRDARDETKYEHMLAFGRALPRIRKCVEAVPSRQGAAGYRFAATMRGDDAGVIRLTPYLVRAAHQCEAAGRVP